MHVLRQRNGVEAADRTFAAAIHLELRVHMSVRPAHDFPGRDREGWSGQQRCGLHVHHHRLSMMITHRRFAPVALLLLMSGCSLDDPLALKPEDVLTVDAVPAQVPADATTRIPIRVTLGNDTPSGTSITLTTDAGSFVGAAAATPKEITIKAVGRSFETVLTAGLEPMIATIRASAGGFTTSDTVVLVISPPTQLQLTSDVVQVAANGVNGITFTARLLRPEGGGKPSRGLRVLFRVLYAGAPAPELESTSESDDSGIARRTLTTRAAGEYKVIASYGAVADTAVVNFTQPPSTR
jgi:hypothetical protein